MSPLRANESPEYTSNAPEPLTKPPPCTHTSTGRRPLSMPGVLIFRFRQSSPSGSTECGPRILAGGTVIGCGADAPCVVASRTPAHGGGAAGGRQRSALANGTPRNTATPLCHRPRSRPAVVGTDAVSTSGGQRDDDTGRRRQRDRVDVPKAGGAEQFGPFGLITLRTLANTVIASSSDSWCDTWEIT